jgi:adenosylhomocysteine nucleosidase/adenosylhomocysteine/aminodeoxyfutalosine nucleosidase
MANGVECVVIKGISDFPKEVRSREDYETFMEQYNTYANNVPLIMNDIFDNHLEYAMKNRFNYVV